MYKELYKKIIDTAKAEHRSKGSGTYYEKHHVVPDFMFKNRRRSGPSGHLDGDPDSANNIVLLTFREHLLCHYYLYEILKGTRYEISAGCAIQFFFVKATGDHMRQVNLSEVDEAFLSEMEHLRQIGIDSISKSKKGKFPAIDAVTRQSVGSVPVDHPKVLSKEWVHHTTGRKFPNVKKPPSSGDKNPNYKEMTPERRQRVFKCVERSLFDDGSNYVSSKKFKESIKEEFSEFNKISYAWVFNNFGNMENLIAQYNIENSSCLEYSPYYGRSKRKTAND